MITHSGSFSGSSLLSLDVFQSAIDKLHAEFQTAIGALREQFETERQEDRARLERLEGRRRVQREKHAQLALRVAEEARKLASVSAAYVHDERMEFALVGPEWSEELSEAGAALAVNLQMELATEECPYIDGGFESSIDDDRRWAGWTRVFP